MLNEFEMLPGYKSQSGFSYVYEKHNGEQELVVTYSCNQGGYVSWVIIHAKVDDAVEVVSAGYEKYGMGFPLIRGMVAGFLI